MGDDVIDIEDFEVKDKKPVVIDDDEDDSSDYSSSRTYDSSSNGSFTAYSWSFTNDYRMLILFGVVLILIIIFVLTFC